MTSSAAKNSTQFDWSGELNKTVTHSLVTTFGLDFLLFEDKKGGDVDTIHNVRQGVWATDEARRAFENREVYDSHAYHQDINYIQRGRADKTKQQAGELVDNYRGTTLATTENRQLDHIISAHEIHNDPGRILAGLSGVKLANQDSNFQSTNGYLNNKKSNLSMQDFVEKLPKFIQDKQQSIAVNQQELKKLTNMSEDTPEQRHKKQQLKDKIRKDEEHLKTLEMYYDKKDEMLNADKKARDAYNDKVNSDYYKSSKFWKNTGTAAASQGFRMGVRQAVGLVLAEVWFELKEAIPNIIKKCRADFRFETFWGELKITLTNIFERVKLRFKDMLTAFKDGFIGGILSSITTVFLNVFFTTGKLLGRLIRESWNNLVQAIKLVVFNPEDLAFGDLMRELARIILASVSTIAGVALNQHLNTVLTIPFGTEISSFISALLTGLLVMGTGYFLDYNQTMQKLWAKLNAWNLQDEMKQTLQQVQAANEELDRFAAELAKLEFGLNPLEFEDLIYSLNQSSSEIEKSYVLKQEVERRNIELPFEMGNSTSTVSWLKSLEVKS